LLFSIDARVSFVPVPARTGTAPPASSTVISMTRSCSFGVIVTASPVVPHGTSTSMLLSICRQTVRLRAASSRSSDFVKGVMSATPAPAKERAMEAS